MAGLVPRGREGLKGGRKIEILFSVVKPASLGPDLVHTFVYTFVYTDLCTGTGQEYVDLDRRRSSSSGGRDLKPGSAGPLLASSWRPSGFGNRSGSRPGPGILQAW